MRRRGLAVLILGVALAVTAAWRVGSVLSAPAPRSIGDPPAGLGGHAVVFPSDSGSTLHGWLVPGDDRGVVVLAHSVRSNRLEMVERAEFLRDGGYSVLLFDAQAHGESSGERITFGLLESRDAQAAVEYARSEFPGERIGYLGVSQGGAAALLAATPLPVDALVLEAVYPSIREAISNRVSMRVGPVSKLLAPLLLVQIQLRLGVSPDEIAPIDGIARARAPILIIAGDRDRHTTLAESQRLFAAAPDPKSLWVVTGASHENFHRFSRSEYERRVLAFFGEFLRGASAVP